MSPTRIAIETLGCKLNHAESEALARGLAARGYCIVTRGAPADVVVANTCTVTAEADAKSRHLLRHVRRQHPEALVAVAGCFAERDREAAAVDGAVDLVVGNADKDRLASIIETLRPPERDGLVEAPSLRTRASVKVQDGCYQGCSYCIVPRVRGRGRSVPVERVLAEVRERAAEGYQEVVLTGTCLGAYGGDLGPADADGGLVGLLRRVLAETGVPRLRLSSLQPRDLTPELLALWSTGRLCRHLHLPLQSGSDRVLESMRRRYHAGQFAEAVALAREAIPGLSVTTDVIAGFPGEGDGEFKESYRFCQTVGFSRIHVFPYSARPGTPAAALPGRVDEREKHRRVQAMMALGAGSARRFQERFLGREVEVLWERGSDDGFWEGTTDNYLRVRLHSGASLGNRVLPARLIGTDSRGLVGELAPGCAMASTAPSATPGAKE